MDSPCLFDEGILRDGREHQLRNEGSHIVKLMVTGVQRQKIHPPALGKLLVALTWLAANNERGADRGPCSTMRDGRVLWFRV
jgi:hypothetical protein